MRKPIDWPTIDPLLCTMTDAALSRQTGVPELTILRRRKRLGVRSFAHQRIIDGAVNPQHRFVEKARIRPDLSSVCPFVRERRKSCKSP